MSPASPRGLALPAGVPLQEALDAARVAWGAAWLVVRVAVPDEAELVAACGPAPEGPKAVTELPCPPEALLERLSNPALWQAGPVMRLRRLQGVLRGAMRRQRRRMP